MFRIDGNRAWNNDLRPVAKVIEHAIEDLPDSDVEQTGFLCDDIREMGFEQRLAIDTIFPPPTLKGGAARLATQV